MKPLHSFGVISFRQTSQVAEVLSTLHRWSRTEQVTVTFHPLLADIVPEGAVVAAGEEAFLDKSEVLISVGGDGTFLSVAHLCIANPKPVIGVNLGGLGFLTGIGPDDIEQQLCRLCHGDYRTIDRVFLKAELVRAGRTVHTFRALNDVFVNRADKPKLASLSVWLGDELINDFLADGLIVATPAGSTAYSLAAGGPIVEPSSRTLLLTPICPHSLTERPLVVPDDRTVRIRVSPRNPVLLLSADGMDTERLKPGDEVVIGCDRNRASLIQLSESSFFQSLRSKLGWGTNSSRRRRDQDDT